MSVTRKQINLRNLLVNTENYRFEPLNGQREAIDKVIEDQQDNLFNLAEDIAENGLSPSDIIQVAPSQHAPNKFIVLEGNRRTVAMKLALKPDLIEAPYLRLKKKFSKIQIGKITNSIECLVYDDPSEADLWIGLKHGYGKPGVVTDDWDPIQKQRFAEKTGGKTSIALQVLKALKDSDEVESDFKKSLNNVRTTNLDRLIGDPYVRQKIGVGINNGILESSIDQKEVIKGYTRSLVGEVEFSEVE